jgi:putative redox protein
MTLGQGCSQYPAVLSAIKLKHGCRHVCESAIVPAFNLSFCEDPAMATKEVGTVVEVEETLTGRYMQTARTGRHAFTADEPVSAGGNDAGPGPYELLLMALGSCTSMTLRMYAELKKLPLERVRVKLIHRKIHADDCADCATREGRIDEITREIELYGDLTAEQRQRLLEIANKCPVHRTLTSEIKIRSQLVEVAGTANIGGNGL